MFYFFSESSVLYCIVVFPIYIIHTSVGPVTMVIYLGLLDQLLWLYILDCYPSDYGDIS